MVPRYSSNHGEEQEEGWNGGKIEWNLSEVTTRAVSRGQSELIGLFMPVFGDLFIFSVRVPLFIPIFVLYIFWYFLFIPK